MGLNIVISDDLAKMVEAKIRSGQYSSASEVVEAALLQLEMSSMPDFNAEQIAWLRDAWNEGLASADVGDVDFEAIKREGRRRLAERR